MSDTPLPLYLTAVTHIFIFRFIIVVLGPAFTLTLTFKLSL